MIRTIYIFAILFTIHLFVLPADSEGAKESVHHWPVSTYELQHLDKALREYSNRNWRSSILRDYNPKDRVIKKILKWKELVSGSPAVNFKEIVEFVKYNPNWPLQKTLKVKAEQNINTYTDPDDIIRWFAINAPIIDSEVKFKKPLTARGKWLLAEAMIKSHKKYKVQKRLIITLLKQTFVEMDFSIKEEKSFLEKYWKIIKSKDFQARMDRLLTDRELTSARRMLRHVDEGYKRVYKARLALIKDSNGVDDLIRTVPNQYKNDSGLIYERLKWREKKGMTKGVISLLKKSPHVVSNPEKWWKARIKHARTFVQSGKFKDAYFIIRKHSIRDDRAKIAEAEWLSGWLALRFMKNATEAAQHFENMYNVVTTPVSLARGAYWAGRAYKAKGDKVNAEKWFKEGAKFPLTYYGQLAFVEAGERSYNLPSASSISKTDLANYKRNELAKAAYIMMQIGHNNTGKLFSVAAAEQAQGLGEKILVAQFGLDINKYDYALRTAKTIYGNIREPILNALFPIFKLESINNKPIRNPNPEIVLSIIRQESEFDKDAVSHAGARGLMQLMPRTAKYVAKKLGVKYNKKKLTDQPNYNITLGSAYLAERLKIYNGSYILSFAAYNAGEGNVNKWIKKYGNPREMNLYDVVDWVEKIPFKETNNYVQRVMENVQVYRIALTNKKQSKINVDKDLLR